VVISLLVVLQWLRILSKPHHLKMRSYLLAKYDLFGLAIGLIRMESTSPLKQ